MKEFFGRKILKYQDQIFRDLKTLVAIPSVADASAARRPSESGRPKLSDGF